MKYVVGGKRQYIIPEFDHDLQRIFSYIIEQNLTMSLPSDLVATINAARQVATNDIEGDFVECGVWRGGNALAAKMVFEKYKSPRKVYLFDTFAGMVEPTELDVSMSGHEKDQMKKFHKSQKKSHNEWCFASLEDVMTNFEKAKVDISECIFVEGDVRHTLLNTEKLPEKISILRLDTDWYESTKIEINTLYPRLVIGGVLLLDDYALWEGHRKAVDDYFTGLATGFRPLLQISGEKGRIAIKVKEYR